MDPGVLTGMDPPTPSESSGLIFDLRPMTPPHKDDERRGGVAGDCVPPKFVGMRRRRRFAQVPWAERHRWRCGDVRPAAQAFRPRSQVPEQSYCSAAACQRERRRRWQRAKRRAMPIIARTRHGHSVRGRKAIATTGATYRRTHPQYCESNRDAGRQRQRESAAAAVVGDVCKDGRVKAGFRAFLQELIGSSRRRRGVCKDGRVDRGNHFGIRAIRSKRGRFAKRGRDRGWGAALLALPCMDTPCLDLDLHRLDLRFAGARLVEPRAVERIARSIERGGQIVPCIAVADPPVEVLEGGERLVLIDGYRRVAALRRLGRDTARVECWACDLAEASARRAGARPKAGPSRRSKRRCWCANWCRGLGLSQHEVARRCGRNVSWVSRRLQLLSGLPDAALVAVREGPAVELGGEPGGGAVGARQQPSMPIDW